jgi:hypothetical protein
MADSVENSISVDEEGMRALQGRALTNYEPGGKSCRARQITQGLAVLQALFVLAL